MFSALSSNFALGNSCSNLWAGFKKCLLLNREFYQKCKMTDKVKKLRDIIKLFGSRKCEKIFNILKT